MPAVHVRALAPAGGAAQIDRALRAIATDVAATIGGEPAGTWCTFTAVDRMSIGTDLVHGEGGIVYLDVWIRPRRDEDDGRALVAACLAASRELEVPVEDVWGTLRTVEAGRVFAGGGLLEA
ncbi:MAG: hypothetical protein ABI572_07610 [Actinomycetota bacterium]